MNAIAHGADKPVAKTVKRGATPLLTGCGGPDTFSANGAAGGAGGGGGDEDDGGGGDDDAGGGDAAGGDGAGLGAGVGALAPSLPPPHAVTALPAATPIDKLKKSAARC